MQSLRTRHLILLLGLCACSSQAATSVDAVLAGQGGASGQAGTTSGGAGGAGRRSPLACSEQTRMPVQCGGQTCPTSTKLENDPCFVPCCVTFQGGERCGFRGTSAAFSTQCVLPAQPDPACDEVPQFQGCCEPMQRVCGIVGGFAPGCQTTSRFVTLPAKPRPCGGAVEGDAGI